MAISLKLSLVSSLKCIPGRISKLFEGEIFNTIWY